MAASVHRGHAYHGGGHLFIRSFAENERFNIGLLFASHTRGFGGRAMTLRPKRIGEQHGTRIYLSGRLLCPILSMYEQAPNGLFKR